jgi:hypothetical protein
VGGRNLIQDAAGIDFEITDRNSIFGKLHIHDNTLKNPPLKKGDVPLVPLLLFVIRLWWLAPF